MGISMGTLADEADIRRDPDLPRCRHRCGAIPPGRAYPGAVDRLRRLNFSRRVGFHLLKAMLDFI